MTSLASLRKDDLCNDFAPRHCMGMVSCRPGLTRYSEPADRRVAVASPPSPPERGRSSYIVASQHVRRERYRYMSGQDSNLEAFSYNPSDGSFAPLAYQPST